MVARAIRFIRDSPAGHPDLDQVAAHLPLSNYQFQRIFKEWAGVTPKEYWKHLTLERTKSALREGQTTLNAAYDAGLSGSGRLHDLYVEIEGCTPGSFKARGKSLQPITSRIETPLGGHAWPKLPLALQAVIFCDQPFYGRFKTKLSPGPNKRRSGSQCQNGGGLFQGLEAAA